MIGLMALGLLVLWGYLVKKLVLRATSNYTHARSRPAVRLLLFVVMFMLPVSDELYARHQIDALCREKAVLTIDEQRIKGRSVKVKVQTAHAEVPGVAIPIQFSKVVFIDVDSGDELGSSGSFDINGGLFVRTIGTAEMRSPVVARGYCAPLENSAEAAKRLGFKIVN